MSSFPGLVHEVPEIMHISGVPLVGNVFKTVGIGVFLYCSLLYGMFLFVWNVPCDDLRSMSHSFDSTEFRDGTFMIEYTRHY